MRILGYISLILALLFFFSFIGNLSTIFRLIESQGVFEIFTINFIILSVSNLVVALILIVKGKKWISKKHKPNFTYNKVKVVFGYIFYIITYFMFLASLFLINKHFLFKEESILRTLISISLGGLFYFLARNWTKTKPALEIDKIGKTN